YLVRAARLQRIRQEIQIEILVGLDVGDDIAVDVPGQIFLATAQIKFHFHNRLNVGVSGDSAIPKGLCPPAQGYAAESLWDSSLEVPKGIGAKAQFQRNPRIFSPGRPS